MKFLDGKEQVIDIQLTSYGKYLLSKGKFRPHFYSFYDDGVLYDSEHGGFTEAQKVFDPKRVYGDAPNPTQL